MADPVSLTLAGGAVFGVLSSISQANAQAASLQAQTNAANYNEALYKQQAEQSMAQANNQSNLQAKQAAQVLGKQRAGIAESGIGFAGTGSDLIDQSAVNAEMDRQNILYSGLINAQSLNAQGEQASYQADVAQSQIGNTIMSGYIGAGSSILSGAGNYMGYQNKLNNTNYRGQYGSGYNGGGVL